MSSSLKLEPGALVAGRYRLSRLLGEGGMGVVWSATHEVTRREVALKFLKPALQSRAVDPNVRHRFLREARAACAVRHPNVVEIHDVLELAEDDGTPVMVMDLLQGESLGDKLEREKRIALGELASILLPVVSAVGTAHMMGIVHRDLKPDNIFLSKGERGRDVRVLDFGIAKLTALEGDAADTSGPGASLTGSGALLGTPFYMSPEQIFGEKDIDYRADVWALGIILYECLSGRRPTQADNIGQILKMITTDAIPPLERAMPELAPSVSSIVTRMLARQRERRPSLNEVVRSLQEFAPTVSTPAFGPPMLEPTTKAGSVKLAVAHVAEDVGPLSATQGSVSPVAKTLVETRRRSRRAAWAGTIGGAVAVAAIALVVRRSGRERPPPAPPAAAVTQAVAATTPSTSTSVSAMAEPAIADAGAAPEKTGRPKLAAPPTHVASAPKPSAPPPQPAATTVSPPAANTLGGVVEKPPF